MKDRERERDSERMRQRDSEGKSERESETVTLRSLNRVISYSESEPEWRILEETRLRIDFCTRNSVWPPKKPKGRAQNGECDRQRELSHPLASAKQ